MEFYEESMPLRDSGLDYTIYYISDSTSIFDRINNVIKKGPPFQKEHLLSHMDFYINHTSIFPSLLNFITSEIEMWDCDLQITCAKGLYKSLKCLLQSPLNAYSTHILLLSLSFIQKAIATYAENVSNEYCYYLSQLVTYFNSKRVRLKLTNEIIQFANSLGKFGQDVKNRRLSIFLCCCLLHISNEFNDVLFQRIVMLSTETECIVKRQMAYELNELIKVVPYEHLKEFIIGTIEVSINNTNHDVVSYIEALCAIILNMKICLSFKYKLNRNFIMNAINKVFNEESDFDLIQKPFIALISVLSSKNINEDIFIWLEPLRLFINLYYFKSEQHLEFFLERYEAIMTLFMNDTMFINEMLDVIFELIPSASDIIKKVIYVNIHKITSALPVDNSFWELIQLKNNLGMVFNRNFNIIIAVFTKKQYHTALKIIFDNFDSISLVHLTQNEIEAMLIGFRNVIKFLYENATLYPKYEDIYNKITHATKEYIIGTKGYHIQSTAITLIPHLLKYSTKRNELNTYIKTTIIQGTSFYIRRLFIPFIEEAITILSINMLLILRLIDDLINSILKENIICLKVNALKSFTLILPLSNSNKGFLPYSPMIKEIKAITTEDIETKKALANFFNHNEQVDDETMENERKKQREENDIFSKETIDLNCNNSVNITQKQIIKKQSLITRTRGSKILPPVIMNHSVNQTPSARKTEESISFNNFHQKKALSYKSTTNNFLKGKEPKEFKPQSWNPIFKESSNNLLRIPTIKLISNKQNIKPVKPFKHETCKELKKVSTKLSLTSSFNK